MKVLYIMANPKDEKDSRTLQLGRDFINEYQKNNPDAEIKELDLNKLEISALSKEDLTMIFTEPQNKIKDYAEEFASADKYVFVAPMWNLSFPAKLHEYFDYISYVGTTFKYTENGPIGLLENKKALHITTRGGVYTSGPAKELEMGDRYMRTLLNFFGVKDITTVALDGTNFYPASDLAQMQADCQAKLSSMAKEF